MHILYIRVTALKLKGEQGKHKKYKISTMYNLAFLSCAALNAQCVECACNALSCTLVASSLRKLLSPYCFCKSIWSLVPTQFSTSICLTDKVLTLPLRKANCFGILIYSQLQTWLSLSKSFKIQDWDYRQLVLLTNTWKG